MNFYVKTIYKHRKIWYYIIVRNKTYKISEEENENEKGKKKEEEIKMAKNWTIKEAFTEIEKGNAESITDLGKRFPLATNLITRLTVVKDNPAVAQFVSMLPDYNTVGKLNTVLREGISEDVESEDADTVMEQKSAKEEKHTKVEEEDEDDGEDFESMNGTQLVKKIRAAGLQMVMKKEYDNKWNKANMVDCLKKHLNEAADTDTEEDNAEETENEYAGKTAKELFLMCKKRGIKVEPKKPAKFYESTLLKDDAKKKEVEDGDDENWGEDEEDTKSTKKSDKKSSKQKKEPEETDEWDI